MLALPPLDIDAVRRQFPFLAQSPYGKPLAYLDSAATAQKPQSVIDAFGNVAAHNYSNVHRGAHFLAQNATEGLEAARTTVQGFMNAPSRKEIIFTGSATTALNLVARCFPFAPGDCVLTTKLEHHSNIVPWFLARDRLSDFRVLFAELSQPDFRLDLEDFAAKLDAHRPALVSVAHVSNVLGVVNPIAKICEMAHAVGAKVLVDGSQAAPHLRIDVQALGADFYVFTGHKVYGPTGIGVLWGREDLLESLPPFLGGGEMISSVTTKGAEWAELPYKFEAGTPPIIEAQVLGEAIRFMQTVGIAQIAAHETEIAQYGESLLREQFGETFRLFGPSFAGADARAPVLAFAIGNHHPHDLATLLDRKGVAVRAGNHCAEVLIAELGVPGTLRASIGVYNTRQDIDQLAAALHGALKVLA